MELSKEQTAHEMWIQHLHNRLRPVLYPQSIDDKRAAFMTTRSTLKERLEQALQITSHHETTRLRVNTEGIIMLLEACDRRRLELKDEYHATPPLLFWKRRRLMRQDKDQVLLQEAYKRCVLILTNTPPPQQVPAEQVPPATTLRKVCDQCGGTGYAGPTPDEEMLCTHCKGSGTEPTGGEAE